MQLHRDGAAMQAESPPAVRTGQGMTHSNICAALHRALLIMSPLLWQYAQML
jgi:hypothetical protein